MLSAIFSIFTIRYSAAGYSNGENSFSRYIENQIGQREHNWLGQEITGCSQRKMGEMGQRTATTKQSVHSALPI
jgi:hypothetical protein